MAINNYFVINATHRHVHGKNYCTGGFFCAPDVMVIVCDHDPVGVL